MRRVRSAMAVLSVVSVMGCQTIGAVGNSIAPQSKVGTAPALPNNDSRSGNSDGAATMRGQGVVGITSARRVNAAARANNLSSAASAESSRRKTIVIVGVVVAAAVIAAFLLSGGFGLAD